VASRQRLVGIRSTSCHPERSRAAVALRSRRICGSLLVEGSDFERRHPERSVRSATPQFLIDNSAIGAPYVSPAVHGGVRSHNRNPSPAGTAHAVLSDSGTNRRSFDSASARRKCSGGKAKARTLRSGWQFVGGVELLRSGW